jgi:tellurite resistance protein TerC
MMAWVVFITIVIILLALDLGVFHKKGQAVSMKESLIWTMVWIALALMFGVVLFFVYKHNLFGINHHQSDPFQSMINYLTGYVIEESLSLDNIFVMAMIFSYFKIKKEYQHNILFWGILGAIVFRGLMILLGTAFIERFNWSTYVFGAILIYSAIKMMNVKQEDVDYGKNPALRLLSRIFPINWEDRSMKFFAKKDGKTYATVAMACLIVIEFTDIIFAVDSVPAIFAVTTDPFIVFTSNIFAILGLRNLYFFLANVMDKFAFMKYSLVFILVFVGIKMGLTHHYHIPTGISLSLILGSLATGILTSVLYSAKEAKKLNKKSE